jgi:ubiquinol-cytochrome c reductase iron-sulfur subunit
VRALARWLVAGLVLLLARGKPQREREGKRTRLVDAQPSRPRLELTVAVLLLLCGLCAIGFVVAYVVDRIPAQTQWMGLALGGAFAFLAAALGVASRALVPVERISAPYPEPAHPEAQEEVAQIAGESGDRISRGRLLKVAAGGAGACLGAALLAPVASLGPVADPGVLRRSPWRRGKKLVDETGRVLRAADVTAKTFLTAYPQGADQEELGSPLVVIRLERAQLDLPEERRGWAPEGILAYSKICTHAGCAISLYRAPTYEPTSDKPALVCPCHYSTFDPADGGSVTFGPAGRPLPQLPLRIARDGTLEAAGDFSGAIGPSWWGVRFR